ncbi:MAG: methionine--tRNA ligase [Syntrophales bacterium]|jgi:methionyl-tRNA synthetase|nr:methionine--tRNA ligase [Syntrophales bacterium]MCK9527700.1 methionine--tRNA ligase [Syntrophales bacterium]
MKDAFYITTPIYYVNAPPHIGHAFTTIVADVMARFHRMMGKPTFFLTGTDEHGDKIAEAAAAAGISPREYADMISSKFRELWPRLNITNDYFIRTTDENHQAVVRSILQKVYDAGDIYFGEYEGNYCVGCERFYRESELVDGRCPDHRSVPEVRKESNYFFTMSKYQDWLIRYITDNPDFIRPERYRNEALAFLREPLEDLCISRPKSRLTWGITLPFDDNYVTYVWFDALINYITGLGYPDHENFRTFWPSSQHLIAKDILKPHGIYWPTMLKAAGIEPYRHLNVHGYWNIDAGKMSKSRGTVVKPLDLKDKYGLDAFRYYLMREMVFGLDAGFSEEGLVGRLNSDLANDLGNLVSRSLSMAVKYCAGAVPLRGDGSDELDGGLIRQGESLAETLERSFESLQFHRALMTIWEFINAANKYIVTTEPWVLARTDALKNRLQEVMYNVLEALRVIAVALSPFMPDTSTEILRRLGLDEPPVLDAVRVWGGLRSGSVLDRGEALFPRVSLEKESAEVAEIDMKDIVDIQAFQQLDIRVARVLEAQAVPKSSKLIQLTIDVGEERTIVAGIGQDYNPGDLEGKLIAVVVNLKPVTIMGVESRGMLLAAEDKGGLSLVTFDGETTAGARIG